MRPSINSALNSSTSRMVGVLFGFVSQFISSLSSLAVVVVFLVSVILLLRLRLSVVVVVVVVFGGSVCPRKLNNSKNSIIVFVNVVQLKL